MTLEELKAKLAKQREFQVERNGARFLMRMPNDREVRRISRPHLAEDDSESALRELVRHSLRDWEGVTERHIVDSGGDELVPFNEGIAMAWIDEDRALWNELSDALLTKINAYREQRQATEKNSQSVLPQSGTETKHSD